MKRSRINQYESLSLPKEMKERKKYNVVAGKTEDNLLQLTIYLGNEMNPSYDVFIDKDNEDWINRVYRLNDKPKFSDTMINNLCHSAWYYGTTYYGDEKIEELFPKGVEKDSILLIGKWQSVIRTKRTDKKNQKKFDRWDEELAIFPQKILPSFKKFMKREADGKYFMFYKNKDAKIGYCSHCEKEVPLMKAPKQNQECRCSSCRVKAVYKRQDRIQTIETGYYSGAYAQKIDDKIIIRKFYGRQYYRNCNYKNPKVVLDEVVRYILYKDGTVSRFWHGMYNPRICRWIKNKADESWARTYTYNDYSHVRNVYMKNIAPILKKSAWECWEKKPTDLMRYLIIETQTQGVIEKLAKIGLFNVAKKIMRNDRNTFAKSVNLKGKDLGQILKIDKARLKRLREFDSDNYYEWLKKEKEQNIIYDDQMLKNFCESNLNIYSFSTLPSQMTYTEINNYILKQAKMSGEEYKQVLSTWKDYLSLAKRNGWDIKNSIFYKPKDLKEMHAKAILFRDGSSIVKEVKEIEEKWPKVNENLAIMKPFAYEDDEYCIVVPNNVEDIVKEGHSLQHCIHQVEFYFDRTEKRESYIFFLRKKSKPDLSWYTLEVEQNGNILQKRTTGDNQNKDLVPAIPFLKEFQKHFISKMSEEDKHLGKIAEENRKKRYEELRKNENKIWHGKLAGQLLADVLEADLMIA